MLGFHAWLSATYTYCKHWSLFFTLVRWSCIVIILILFRSWDSRVGQQPTIYKVRVKTAWTCCKINLSNKCISAPSNVYILFNKFLSLLLLSFSYWSCSNDILKFKYYWCFSFTGILVSLNIWNTQGNQHEYTEGLKYGDTQVIS